MLLWNALAIVWQSVLAVEIVLLAYERPEETLRCLRSLETAFYPSGEVIPLRVRVDRHLNGTVNRDVIEAVESFAWTHGTMNIFIHPEHVGLQRQWLSVVATDYTLIIEDDIVVSPFYYYALSHALRCDRRNLLGISLQRPQWQIGANEHGRFRRLDLLRAPPLYAFQAPSTWGLLVFPTPWNVFLNTHNMKGMEGAITTKWARERECELISPLIEEFLVEREMSILWFWPGNRTVLATSRNAMRGHYADLLLEDEKFLKKLDRFKTLPGAASHSSIIPMYSGCFDRIEFKGNHPSVWRGKDPSRFTAVIRHLRNVCRIAKVNIVNDETGFGALDPINYNFDCNVYSTYPMDIKPPHPSIRCNYTIGLYPHNISPT